MLSECEEYASARHLGMSRRQLMECYMIMGGIPYYWSLLDKSESLAQNIDRLFFSADGDLRHEYSELYASLFKTPEPYISVIEALDSKRIGLSRKRLSERVVFQTTENSHPYLRIWKTAASSESTLI